MKEIQEFTFQLMNYLFQDMKNLFHDPINRSSKPVPLCVIYSPSDDKITSSRQGKIIPLPISFSLSKLILVIRSGDHFQSSIC
jgi:hypothetical protein